MIAIVNTSRSIRDTFYYNESKVKRGMAKCIGDTNFSHRQEPITLNFLLEQLALNKRVKRNTVHISLNFDPLDIDLSEDRLRDISRLYMDKIGLGEQPYRVYQHFDAAHPHLHIVSIRVRADATSIPFNRPARKLWQAARLDVEKTFDLIRIKKQNLERPSIALGKIQYGKTPSFQSIETVLKHVLFNYCYSNLQELNAILQQYNVLANRGTEKSKTFQNNGLLYHILNKNGKTIGKPIKASLFKDKPGLKFLQERFLLNQNKAELSSKRIKNAVTFALFGNKPSFSELTKILEKQGIKIICYHQGATGGNSILYIDYNSKCVFSDFALGKQYTASSLLQLCQIQACTSTMLDSGNHLEKTTILDAIPMVHYAIAQNQILENQEKKQQRKRRKNQPA